MGRAIKSNTFARARRPIFHDVILAHNMQGFGSVSGLSCGIPGRDLVVLIIDGAEGNFDDSCVGRTPAESSLNERVGIRLFGNPEDYGTRWKDAGCAHRVSSVIRPLDWNGNGSIDAGMVAVDVNNGTTGTQHVYTVSSIDRDGRALSAAVNRPTGARPPI